MNGGNNATTHLVRIGNSRGVRIPKVWIEQLDFGEEVEMSVQADRLIIRSAHHARQDWDAQFRAMHERGDDQLIAEDSNFKAPVSSWDEEEWQW
jgi:antitoxin MazE